MTRPAPTTTFLPGDATAVVVEGAVSLVAAGVSSPACVVIENALSEGFGLDRIMTSLSSLGFTALPGLAIAVAVPDGVQLLHRGIVSVEVETTDGQVQGYSSPKVTTWREEFVADAAVVRLIVGSVTAPETHRIGVGTIPARQISWVVTKPGTDSKPTSDAKNGDTSSVTAPPAEDVESVAGQQDVLRETSHPLLPELAKSQNAVAQIAESSELNEQPIEPAGPIETSQVAGHSAIAALTIYPSDTAQPIPSSAPPLSEVWQGAAPIAGDLNLSDSSSTPPSTPTAPPPSNEADDLDFSNLVSHTVFRNVEDAAIRPLEHEESIATKPLPVPAGHGNETISPERTVMPPPGAGGSSMISGVPQSGVLPAGVLADEGDHDGRTVARPRKKSPPPSAQAAAPPTSNAQHPMIQSVRCVAGHFNAPNAHQCRICNQPVVDRMQILTPRPSLGVLRFSTSAVVAINGPILIGRNPPVNQMVDGETAAVVPIDNGELSRFHAAIHLTEWFVHVADQASMNGTMVTAPGKPRQTLRPYEKVQITPGTIVELGGAVSFRFDGS
jgi:FHA domain